MMFKIFLYIFIALNLLTGGVWLYLNNSEIRNTITLATTVKPETLTELYFEDHINLPSKVEPEKEYSFKFTIHNLENQDMNYPYEVYTESEGIKTQLNQNSVFVKKDEYKTITTLFTPIGLNPKTKIVVNLSNKNQQIAFWVAGEESK